MANVDAFESISEVAKRKQYTPKQSKCVLNTRFWRAASWSCPKRDAIVADLPGNVSDPTDQVHARRFLNGYKNSKLEKITTQMSKSHADVYSRLWLPLTLSHSFKARNQRSASKCGKPPLVKLGPSWKKLSMWAKRFYSLSKQCVFKLDGFKGYSFGYESKRCGQHCTIRGKCSKRSHRRRSKVHGWGIRIQLNSERLIRIQWQFDHLALSRSANGSRICRYAGWTKTRGQEISNFRFKASIRQITDCSFHRSQQNCWSLLRKHILIEQISCHYCRPRTARTWKWWWKPWLSSLWCLIPSLATRRQTLMNNKMQPKTMRDINLARQQSERRA